MMFVFHIGTDNSKGYSLVLTGGYSIVARDMKSCLQNERMVHTVYDAMEHFLAFEADNLDHVALIGEADWSQQT